MSLASEIGVFALQWAIGTFLLAALLRGGFGRGWWVGASFVPLERERLGRRDLIFLLAVSAVAALPAVICFRLLT